MFVQTKSSLLRRKGEESCETVSFTGKQSASKGHSDMTNKAVGEAVKKEDKTPDLKKLRYEVIKFGSSGFEGSKKEESRVALAVSLGAVPRKKKHKNYAQILAEKKAEKKEKGDGKPKQTIARNFENRRPTKQKKTNRNKCKGLLNHYGRVNSDK